MHIRGVQRDLVVTGFFFICNWFKLYKYKLARIENGTEKSKNTGDRQSSGLYPFVLECWDGRPDIPVLVLALALRALLLGRLVL